MQLDFIEGRVEESIRLLRELEPEDGYYLAFSGGKDSVVLYALAKLSGVRFDAHYSLTTVDPPELVHFIRENYKDVIIDLPKMTMWELMVKNLYPPTRLMRYCCKELKEGGGGGRFVLTGVRAAESARRAKRRQIETCTQGKGRRFLHPIFNWSDSDVWDFINENYIKYCGLYDEGYKRLGCIGCPMGNTNGMEADFIRWPKYKAQYLRTLEKIQVIRKEHGKKPLGNDYTADGALSWWIGEIKIHNIDVDELFYS